MIGYERMVRGHVFRDPSKCQLWSTSRSLFANTFSNIIYSFLLASSVWPSHQRLLCFRLSVLANDVLASVFFFFVCYKNKSEIETKEPFVISITNSTDSTVTITASPWWKSSPLPSIKAASCFLTLATAASHIHSSPFCSVCIDFFQFAKMIFGAFGHFSLFFFSWNSSIQWMFFFGLG